MKPGAVVGRYRIVSVLGVGGMGEVYRAVDSRLKREVALKVLPADLVGDPDRRNRFFREAEATAALCHPRIATVYDADDADGVCYLAMELVSGAPLTERLRSGPLPAAEALAMAGEIGEGLACAHAGGILHRDLKPANVILDTNGHAKLIDFGLAKLLEPASGETTTGMATADGRVLGTAAYMAPEQARGLPVDARTDIFSFGLLLYELLTGCRPFDRGSWPDSVAAVLRDPVPPLAVPGFTGESAGLAQRLLDRCLAKDAASRPGSMADVLRDLDVVRRMITPSASGENADSARRPAAEQASIVVLPFENLSPDPDNAFFADGLTEELIADLSKIRALRVISRTSAMHYRGTTKPLPAIARELGVGHVLEGSVRRAGNNLRITAQLIQAATDAHLWAEKYSGTLDDVFDLQEQLSRRIVEALRVVLTPGEELVLTRHAFDNAAAHDCYLRATYEANSWTKDGLDRAEQYLRDGVAIIGEHPAILAGLAYVHTQRVNLGFAQDELIAEAVSLAERALTLDPANPQAHAVRGVQMMVLDADVGGSLRHLAQAVAGAPDDVVSAGWLAFEHVVVGQPAVGAAIVARAVERDPLNPSLLLMKGVLPFFEGRFDDAAALCAVPYEMMPAGSMFVYWYSVALAYAGRSADCWAVVERIGADPGDDAPARVAMMTARTLSGDPDGVAALMTPTFEATARRDGQTAWNVAACYAAIGDADRAIVWLESAIDRNFVPAEFLATVDPFLAPLRGSRRFEALMDRARGKQRAFGA